MGCGGVAATGRAGPSRRDRPYAAEPCSRLAAMHLSKTTGAGAARAGAQESPARQLYFDGRWARAPRPARLAGSRRRVDASLPSGWGEAEGHASTAPSATSAPNSSRRAEGGHAVCPPFMGKATHQASRGRSHRMSTVRREGDPIPPKGPLQEKCPPTDCYRRLEANPLRPRCDTAAHRRHPARLHPKLASRRQ